MSSKICRVFGAQKDHKNMCEKTRFNHSYSELQLVIHHFFFPDLCDAINSFYVTPQHTCTTTNMTGRGSLLLLQGVEEVIAHYRHLRPVINPEQQTRRSMFNSMNSPTRRPSLGCVSGESFLKQKSREEKTANVCYTHVFVANYTRMLCLGKH